ncbi:MAG: cytochrome c biogenesis protein CcsA, partial [Chloroflexota bacterium]|nr:cytochrome c biogenesis protein CcsA [Chloroflexota bacterium]
MSSKTAPPTPFIALAALASLAALAAIFFYAPREAVQGEVQRVLYIHVGTALAAYISFLVTAAASVAVLAGRGDAADRLARSAAIVGVVFTTVVLATGAIWGRAVWGVWWTWDARLTTTLVLWFVQA